MNWYSARSIVDQAWRPARVTGNWNAIRSPTNVGEPNESNFRIFHHPDQTQNFRTIGFTNCLQPFFCAWNFSIIFSTTNQGFVRRAPQWNEVEFRFVALIACPPIPFLFLMSSQTIKNTYLFLSLPSVASGNVLPHEKRAAQRTESYKSTDRIMVGDVLPYRSRRMRTPYAHINANIFCLFALYRLAASASMLLSAAIKHTARRFLFRFVRFFSPSQFGVCEGVCMGVRCLPLEHTTHSLARYTNFKCANKPLMEKSQWKS